MDEIIEVLQTEITKPGIPMWIKAKVEAQKFKSDMKSLQTSRRTFNSHLINGNVSGLMWGLDQGASRTSDRVILTATKDRMSKLKLYFKQKEQPIEVIDTRYRATNNIIRTNFTPPFYIMATPLQLPVRP